MRGAVSRARLAAQGVALIAAVLAARALAAEPPVLGADELAAALRQNGRAGPAVIDEDVDLSRLKGPADAADPAIELRDVRFRGRLRGAPAAPLRMVGGSICALEAQGAVFAHPLDLQGVAIGAARLARARLGAAWTCLECRFCRANFEQAKFLEGATFTGAAFGEPPPGGLCREPIAAGCGAADFAEARFAGPARFDRTSFRAGASFDAAEFRDSARFARSAAAGPIGFLGARFRRDAEFRDCAFADAYFGPSIERPAIVATTEFAGRADFRGCRFGGAARFDEAVLAGDALFGRARFSGPVASFRGVLASRSLDLRGTVVDRPDAAVELDPTAADAVRLDWDTLGPPVLRGLPAEARAATLDSLSRRLDDAGESRAALAVGFEAKRVRRRQEALCGDDSLGGCAASEAEWWLWTWPTRNGSDLTLPLAALALLWAATAAAGLPRGHIVIPPARREDAEPIWDCLAAGQFPDGAYCALGPRRAGEAAGFATGLVFKLGSRRQRMAGPGSSGLRVAASLALRLVSLLGWAMIALAAGVIAASFPGLRALAP